MRRMVMVGQGVMEGASSCVGFFVRFLGAVFLVLMVFGMLISDRSCSSGEQVDGGVHAAGLWLARAASSLFSSRASLLWWATGMMSPRAL